VPLGWGQRALQHAEATVAPVDWDYLWVHQELSKRMTLLNDVREVMVGRCGWLLLQLKGRVANQTSL